MIFLVVNEIRLRLNNCIIIDIPYEDTDEEYISEIKNTNNYITPQEYISKYILKYNVKGIF